MKKLAFIFLILLSCAEEEPVSNLGCSIGYRVGEPKVKKVLLRCCTQNEHLAGNNTNAGGISYFQNYTEHEWISVSNCNECDKYRQ